MNLSKILIISGIAWSFCLAPCLADDNSPNNSGSVQTVNTVRTEKTVGLGTTDNQKTDEDKAAGLFEFSNKLVNFLNEVSNFTDEALDSISPGTKVSQAKNTAPKKLSKNSQGNAVPYKPLSSKPQQIPASSKKVSSDTPKAKAQVSAEPNVVLSSEKDNKEIKEPAEKINSELNKDSNCAVDNKTKADLDSKDNAKTEVKANNTDKEDSPTKADLNKAPKAKDSVKQAEERYIKGARGAVVEMQRSVTGEDDLDLTGIQDKFTLQKSLDIAMDQNPSLKVANEEVVTAQAQYGQQKSQKNLQFVVNDKTTWQNRQTSGAMVTLESLTNQLSASLRYLLTTFGKVENEIAASFLQIGVKAIQYSSAKHELCYDVKQAFFERLRADSYVDVAELNLTVCKQSLADSQKMFAQGIMARYDVIQSELQVTEAEEQLAKSKNAVEACDASFLKLLNLTRSQATVDNVVHLVPPALIEVDPDCTLQQLTDLALARRFEILSVDRSIEAAQAMRKAADCLNKPEVSLSANYIFSPGYNTYPSSIYQLNLGIDWAPFDGGFRKNKKAEADSQIRSLEATREELATQIRLEVEKSWLNFQLTDVTLATAKKRVEASWVYHDMARQRFLNGLGTSLEVQNALNSLNNARQSFVVANYDRELAFSQIEYSVGTDFPDRRLTVQPEMMVFPEQK